MAGSCGRPETRAMPFDDTNYKSVPDPAPPPPSKRLSRREEAFVLIVCMAVAVALIVLPVSAAAFGDIVHYLQHR